MRVLGFFWVLGTVVFTVLYVTQLVIPWWNGTHVFPWFRKARSKIEDELTDAREQDEVSQKQRELDELRKRIEKRMGSK